MAIKSITISFLIDHQPLYIPRERVIVNALSKFARGRMISLKSIKGLFSWFRHPIIMHCHDSHEAKWSYPSNQCAHTWSKVNKHGSNVHREHVSIDGITDICGESLFMQLIYKICHGYISLGFFVIVTLFFFSKPYSWSLPFGIEIQWPLK